MRRGLVVLIGLLVLLLVGCGGDDGADPAPAPAASDRSATSDPPVTTDAPAEFDPSSALLRLDDLPAGARAIAERTDAMELVRRGLFRQEVCGEVIGSPDDLVAGRYSSFDASGTNPPLDIVNHGVFDLDGTAAEDRMERYDEVASTCSEPWTTTGNGVTVAFEVIDEIELPDLGFPAVGFELSYQEAGQAVAREWFVMMRSDQILSSVVIVAPAGTDQSHADAIFENAADRLRSATAG